VHATDPCPHCNGKGIDPIEQVVRLGVFHEPLKTLVHRMKYRHGWPIAEVLAERVMVHPPVKALLADSDCLVPLPLHPRRQWERGYNQAEVIARRLSWRTRLPVRSPLVRVRNSPSQTTLHAQAKRWENVRDVFRLIDAAAVGGRRVVLVDDVMTSGSTLRAAALALAAAKPAGISVLTIAVADPKGRAYQAF
jgi:ComF family protein